MKKWAILHNLAFDKEQRKMLKKAFASAWITQEDIKIIANPLFSVSQMREIKRACEELPREKVLEIAHHDVTAVEMHKFRMKNREYERH